MSAGEPIDFELHRPEGPLDLHQEGDRKRVEGAIRELPGVVAARVVAGYERPVDELHVVTSPGKAAKQVVRDVQSLLYATFGLSTDHRVISVVQVDTGEEIFGQGTRVAIQRVTAVHEDLEVRVTVQITADEVGHTGEAVGPASAPGRRRAAARAALDAARPLLGDRYVVEVEGVAIEDVLGHEVAITFVHFHGAHGARTISGTAMVRDDEANAIARSVLDALNRELTAAE